MASGRWILLALMACIGPLLWWSGVRRTTSAANAALLPGDPTLPIFVSNYHSGAMAMVGFFALINLLLVLAAVPSDRQVRKGYLGTIVHAAIGTALITGLVWIEYRLSPATYNWSGDPDARSLVKEHMRPWPPVALNLWVALHTAVAGSIVVRALRCHFQQRSTADPEAPEGSRPG